MVANISNDGNDVYVFDANKEAATALAGEKVTAVNSIDEITAKCTTIISMLPNDKAVESVSAAILANKGVCKTHIGCSTVSPTTSRRLAAEFKAAGMQFIASPVFARPDGLANRQAVWMVAGEEEGRKIAAGLLESSGRVSVLCANDENHADYCCRSLTTVMTPGLRMSSNYVEIF